MKLARLSFKLLRSLTSTAAADHYRRMKTIIIAVALVFCFLVVASAQNIADCARRATRLSNCSARQRDAARTGDTTAFCRDCGNYLVGYFEDCARGVGVDAVKTSKLMQNLSIHYTVSDIITDRSALALSGEV